jgi:hypothetical protein
MGDGSDQIEVLKLHGSVRWWKRWQGQEAQVVDASDLREYELQAHHRNEAALFQDDPVIATPGVTKQDLTRALPDLWDRAERLLETAEAVVFVGYRFPETDAEARRRLLGALRKNKQQYLRVHVVLGPDSPDVPRLRSLLTHTLERSGRLPWGVSPKTTSGRSTRYAVVVHPLFAEDFFTVYDQALLLEPHTRSVH